MAIEKKVPNESMKKTGKKIENFYAQLVDE